MDFYTVEEFYAELPECDVLIIDEVHYLFQSEMYTPLSYCLYNGVWNLSKYKIIYGFTATVGSYLTDVIENTLNIHVLNL